MWDRTFPSCKIILTLAILFLYLFKTKTAESPPKYFPNWGL